MDAALDMARTHPTPQRMASTSDRVSPQTVVMKDAWRNDPDSWGIENQKYCNYMTHISKSSKWNFLNDVYVMRFTISIDCLKRMPQC